MKKYSLTFLIGFSFLLMPLFVQAQKVEARATINRDTIMVGQSVDIELSMIAPFGFKVEWPFFQDTITKSIEIIESGEIKKQQYDADSNVFISQNLKVTSFDTGQVVIHPIEIRFSPTVEDSIKFTVSTNPLMLQVTTVVADTTTAFRPIKDVKKQPITFSEVYPWVLGVIGLVGVIALIIYIIMRLSRKNNLGEEIKKSKIPPHVTALKELEELKGEKLWQSGLIKEYYSRLTDIVRVYIEMQFDVLAVEMTTDEILEGIKPLNFEKDTQNKLAEMLIMADYVKFAKMTPTPQENDLVVSQSIDFVNESYQTKLIADKIAQETAKANQNIPAEEKVIKEDSHVE